LTGNFLRAEGYIFLSAGQHPAHNPRRSPECNQLGPSISGVVIAVVELNARQKIGSQQAYDSDDSNNPSAPAKSKNHIFD